MLAICSSKRHFRKMKNWNRYFKKICPKNVKFFQGNFLSFLLMKSQKNIQHRDSTSLYEENDLKMVNVVSADVQFSSAPFSINPYIWKTNLYF